MKLYTSYYAQIRNFPSNLIALSTAVWKPKWLNFGTNKNSVIMFNCKPLIPGHECEYLCRGNCEPPHPQDCAFLQTYRKQLDRIDFNDFYSYIEELSKKYNNADFAFMVYETPNRPCSERVVIQQWFREHGIEIEEWLEE